MTIDGNYILKFSTKKEFNGKVFLTIRDTNSNKSISIDPTFVEERDNYYHYTLNIPKHIMSMVNFDEHISVKTFFFLSRDTIHNGGVFGPSSSDSPLYYQNSHSLKNSTVIQLPDAIDDTVFESGTIKGVDGTVHVPKGKKVFLSDDIVCKFDNIEPQQIAKIFRMNMIANNADDDSGLKFTYSFGYKTFSNGAKEQRPSQIY